MLAIIGTITSQVALITASLYYFGWARTNSLFGYFGIDSALVGYSSADYVLRSIDVALPWFICVALIALVLLGIHRLVMVPALMRAKPQPSPPSTTATSDLRDPAPPCATRSVLSRAMGPAVRWVRMLGHWRPGVSCTRRFILFLQVFAIVLAAAVLAGVLFREYGALLGLLLPMLLIVSVTLLGYVAHIRSKYPDVLAATTTPPRPVQPSRAYTLTLLALGLVAGVWEISLYGDRLGTSYAVDIATNLAARSEVVVYSTDRIALHGPGIIVAEIAQSGTKYHYQYTGLRLLARAPDKFLLLPSEWQKGRDHVFLLRDDDSIRVDIAAQ